MAISVRIVCVVFLLSTVAQAAEPRRVVPIDGEPFDARLTGIAPNWQLTFANKRTSRTIPAGDLVRWGTWAEPADGPIVVLADGGLLAADVTGADQESLTVASATFAPKKLPLDAVAGVVFDPPTGRLQRDRLLDRIAQSTGDTDRLLLHNGDVVTGLVEGIEEDAIRIKTNVGPPKIAIDAVAAIIFNPALRRTSNARGLRCWVGLADGSRLLATRLTLKQNTLTIVTQDGQTWATTAENLLALQPLGSSVVYCSDLPDEARHLPYLDLRWPHKRDRGVTGGRLRSAGRLYLKGLGVHSTSRVTYKLDGNYTRFQTDLGIDDSAGRQGSVRFRVYVDRKPTYTSEIIRGGDTPVPLSVDLKGAELLDLIVDYADRANVLDRADWLDARLVKKKQP